MIESLRQLARKQLIRAQHRAAFSAAAGERWRPVGRR